MPAILGNRGEEKVKIETASRIAGEDVFVTIRKALLAEDVDEINEALSETTDTKTFGYKILAQSILSWDFVDSNGTPCPITVENVRKVPMDDLLKLQNHIDFDTQLDNIKKNSLSSISQAGKQEEVPPSNTSS